MRANNGFILTGRLAQDVEFHPGTTPRARIRVAVDGWDRSAKAKKTDFFNVTLWGRDAERVNQYCQKGSYVSVTGEMRENNYVDSQGNKRYETQLVASDITLGPRPNGGGGGGGASAQYTIPDNSDDPYGFGN